MGNQTVLAILNEMALLKPEVLNMKMSELAQRAKAVVAMSNRDPIRFRDHFDSQDTRALLSYRLARLESDLANLTCCVQEGAAELQALMELKIPTGVG